jgi:2-keto-4-pentenoate hydratase
VTAATATLAEALWAARRDGRALARDRDDLPRTLDEAYAVQTAVAALSGAPRRGWKVGSTSAEAQRLLGVDEPSSAPLLAPFVHDSPASLTLPPGQWAAVEGEFALRLGHALPPRDAPYAMADIAAAIDAVAPAIELVGSRFEGGLPGMGRLLTTADCGVSIALVTGPWTAFAKQDLRIHPVAISINAAPAGAGTGARALGDPLNVLLWLTNHLSERGIGLEPGQIVATGTCTGLVPVGPGDVIRADFGALGAVEIALSPGSLEPPR